MLGAKVQFPTTSKESVEKVEKMKKGYGVIRIFLWKYNSNQFDRKTLNRIATIIKRTKLVLIWVLYGDFASQACCHPKSPNYFNKYAVM